MIDVRVEDLAFYDGDAIIRPATAHLTAPTPLLRRLDLAGGTPLAALLVVADPLPIGSAVVTAAGDLPVGLLVHAIVSSATEPVSRDGVRRALRSALERIRAWQIARVAIPPLGLGAGNLDLETSAELLADELTRHRRSAAWPAEVVIVAETEDEAAVLDFAISRWAA